MAEPRVPRQVCLRRRARAWTLATMAGAVASLAAIAILRPAPRLMWNGSASAPLGLYRIERASSVARGDLVLMRPPQAEEELAARRGYLPRAVPLVKRIEAVGGDTVCIRNARVAINDAIVASIRSADSVGRPLLAWEGCRALATHEVFVLMREVPDSFDGRYFGPVARADILGKVVPLWTW